MSVPILSRLLAHFAADLRTRSSGTIDRGKREGAEPRWDCLTGFGVRRKVRGVDGNDPAADLRYLQQWVVEHTGVEAFVEPRTTVTDVTVVLVAADGEWTRRRAGGDAGARRLSEQLKIPVYDVQKVGYPQRMRDYDARRRIERERALREELEG